MPYKIYFLKEDEISEFGENLADEFREELKDGSSFVSEGPWEETARAIKERKAR